MKEGDRTFFQRPKKDLVNLGLVQSTDEPVLINRNFSPGTTCPKNETEDRFVDETVIKINESLSSPKHLVRTLDNFILHMRTNTIDESGGGLYHDIDDYIFSAESLHKLIFKTLGSSDKTSEVLTTGIQNTDMGNWQLCGDETTFILRDKESVALKLNLTIKNGKYIFTADRYDDKREVMAIDETISENGRKVLKMVTDHNSNTKYKYQGQVYEWLGDPALLDFGNLNDLETPCKLVINEYQTPETSTDGDYGEDCREILYFDKKLAIEALSKVKEGITVVTGTGRAVDYKYRYGWSYNENVDENKRDTDKKVEVAIQIDFQPKKSLVNFEFRTRIDPKQDSVVYKRVSFWDSKNIS